MNVEPEFFYQTGQLPIENTNIVWITPKIIDM